MDIVIDVLKVVIGFALLLKGADFFVDGAAAMALKLGIPQIVIGLTIVAFGTSAPEAAVSISAGLKENNGISIGNVVGSNIMNVLIILGVTALITTLSVKKSTVWVDMPFMIGGTILLLLWGVLGKELTRLTGIVLLALLVAYLVYLFIYARRHQDEEEGDIKNVKAWLIPIFILGGMAAIIFGSNIAVDGASAIASRMGVSDRIIGLTIVALGTSLPELMTSVTAARKGNADIAIGNIVGSNIFNIFFILGITSTIINLPFISDTVNFTIDAIIALVAAVLLWLFTFNIKELRRWNGIIFLIVYIGYFIYLVAA